MTITRLKQLLRLVGLFTVFVLFLGAYFFLTDTSTVEIITLPEGATITINGAETGKKSPTTLSGYRIGQEIVVTAKLPGYRDQKRELKIANKAERVVLLLTRSDIPPYEPEPPPPSINPTFIEKLQKEPYRGLLPHWNKNYKIDYIHSNNLIIITILNTESMSAEEKAKYQEEARKWLTANGADLKSFRIEYRTENQ